MSIVDRIQAKVTVEANGCHIFNGSRQRGYGRIGRSGRGAGTAYVHRVMYAEAYGPIPDGLHVDHLCRNRSCCNPEHLEAVTQSENNRRAASHNYPGVRGVHKTNASARNPWMAWISADGKQVHLGLFATWADAAAARLRAEAERTADPERRAAIEAEVAALQEPDKAAS